MIINDSYKHKIQLIIRYGISGFLAALVLMGGLYLLHEWLSVGYLLASTIAYIIAVVVSFILQKWWTFQDDEKESVNKQFTVHVILAVLNIATNALFMYGMVAVFGLWYLLAQFISTSVIAVWSFFCISIFHF